MRPRIRRTAIAVVLAVAAAAVMAAIAFAGTSSKLPTSQPSAAALPAAQASGANPNFIGGVVNFVAGYVAGKALDYVVANRVALAVAVEESTYTTLALATPAGPVNPADVQFDNAGP